MQLIVKPEILYKRLSFLDFLDHKGVDLDNKNTMVKPKNMNIGFGTRSLLTELGRKDKVRSCRILYKCCTIFSLINAHSLLNAPLQ